MVIVEFNKKTEYRNKRGKLHRMDGPAVIFKNGREEWWRNGKRHRLDGPAILESGGESFAWYRKGKKHRIGGPAVQYTSVVQEYWLLGEKFNELEYKMKLRQSIIEKILEQDKLEI